VTTVRKKLVTDDRSGQSEEQEEKEEREAQRGDWRGKPKETNAAEQVGEKCKNFQLCCIQASHCYHEQARGMLIRNFTPKYRYASLNDGKTF
jgi:hypothetical protein